MFVNNSFISPTAVNHLIIQLKHTKIKSAHYFIEPLWLQQFGYLDGCLVLSVKMKIASHDRNEHFYSTG